MHALELAEVQLLHLAGQVTQALQVLDVPAVLAALGALAVDDCDLAGLGYAVGSAFNHGFVDALLDDLVADVVRAVDVEALLVETEADGARRVLHQNQVGGLERHGQPVAELVGAHGDAAREHELPEPQILEADGVEAAVLEQARADVDLVVHAVGLLLLEVVREHGLRGQLLAVEVRGDRLGDASDALLEELSPAVDYAESRVQCAAGQRDPRAHVGAGLAQLVEQALDVRAQEPHEAGLVTGVEAPVDLCDALVDAEAELVERRERLRFAGGAQNVGGEAELGEEVGLDSHATLGGRAADVGQAVQRVDVLEHDRLHL